ncbi:hypothetical protein DYB30_006295 [Aphanomyces astaci]|uniref:PH domain-containing protein n=1 Tax=Aphanomyces astaci TaxID=112090 RepID=A0A397D9E5_APHAT|nr:hypothetical protein DYB30_006295 [Aphanomyces astaci]
MTHIYKDFVCNVHPPQYVIHPGVVSAVLAQDPALISRSGTPAVSMEEYGPRGGSGALKRGSRMRDSTFTSSSFGNNGSPGGTDLLGKLSAMLRGHSTYTELVDDSFDELRCSNSGTPPRPLTPVSPLLTWDLDSPRGGNRRVRSNTMARQSTSSAMRRQSMSPRPPAHDTILVTEFKFLHTSFAPPFPLAAVACATTTAPPVSPFRASVDDVFFDNNDDPEDISIDPDNLRDSVRHLVRHIQRQDSGDLAAMLDCPDVLSPDTADDDDRIGFLLGISMSSDEYPPLQDTTTTSSEAMSSSPESRSFDKYEDTSVSSVEQVLIGHSNQDIDDDNELLQLTPSVRNLVLDLRRDCARHSLHPADLIGVPSSNHLHHHHHHNHHNHTQQLPSQPSIGRHRNHSHPPDAATSPSSTSSAARVHPMFPLRDTKPPHFSRLMSSVAGGLRRLNIHKSNKRPPSRPSIPHPNHYSPLPPGMTSSSSPPASATSPFVHPPTSSPGADIDGARWKIVELAFRFGGPHRYYLVQAVNMFAPLTKYGRRGTPHPTRLVCHPYGTLQWEHKRGGFSAPVDLALASHVVDGRSTAVFHKCDGGRARHLAQVSLSVVFSHRTLDLETQSADHRDWLGSALRTLIQYAKTQRQAEATVMREEEAAAHHSNDDDGPTLPVMAPIIA